MTSTPRLALPYIAAAQAQKHVTHNESLDLLDALLPSLATSATTMSAPGSPVDGEVYIVPTGGSFGAVPAGSLALYIAGGWQAVAAPYGFRLMVLDEGRHRIFAGSRGWVPGDVLGAYGFALGLRTIDLSVTLTGGTSYSFAGAIPTRSIVLGVTTWTQTAVTGPAAYRCGISGELDKFGGFLGVAAGSSNIGLVGPYATYSPADLLISAQDGATAFTGGIVRASIHLIAPGLVPV